MCDGEVPKLKGYRKSSKFGIAKNKTKPKNFLSGQQGEKHIHIPPELAPASTFMHLVKQSVNVSVTGNRTNACVPSSSSGFVHCFYECTSWVVLFWTLNFKELCIMFEYVNAGRNTLNYESSADLQRDNLHLYVLQYLLVMHIYLIVEQPSS